ncbi:MAG: hypothetical protein EWM72_03341 [Nitrospira sp.]|nr:MAG: hypothetical protein EWM72_03341 [Nitrospira sp.]
MDPLQHKIPVLEILARLITEYCPEVLTDKGRRVIA